MTEENITLEIIKKNKIKPPTYPENIYVAYMANDRDLKGVLLLDYNLKKVGSKYSFCILLIENVSDKVRQILSDYGISSINCNLNSTLSSFTTNQVLVNEIINKHYYGKYMVFSLEQFKKVIYLDTDLLLMSNIDHLFDYDLETTNGNSISRLYMVNDMQASLQEDNKYCVVLTKNAFNSGVIIFKPNVNTTRFLFRELVNLGLDGFRNINTDQDIFNSLIKKGILECTTLNMKYNISPSIVIDFLRKGYIDKPYVIHYMLKPKPWELLDGTCEKLVFSNPVSKHLYGLWITTYNEMITSRYLSSQPGSDIYSEKYCYGAFSKDGLLVFNEITELE